MNSNLPNKLASGDHLPAHWLNRLLDWLRSRDLQVGPGLRMSRTPSGTTLSLAGASAGSARPDDSVVVGLTRESVASGICRISVPAGTGTNGRSRNADTLVVPEVTQIATIPNGTAILAHRLNASLEEIALGN